MLTLDSIRAAARRIDGKVQRTPLLRCPVLDERTGARVFIKPECLQITGSFKLRGALNAIGCLPDEERAKGVVAFSSGNHAQGIAYAARAHGVAATIIMPADAPQIKQENTRAMGAEVVLYDRYTEDRDEVAARTAGDRPVIPPFENYDVMAGQGTVGLELFEDLQTRGETADTLLCCCGGGGLMAGIATAATDLSPQTKLYACEPTGFDDYKLSLETGARVSVNTHAKSVCDAIVTASPGENTFAINQPLLAGGLATSDENALKAVRFAFENLKLVAEPGGAIALACLLSGEIDVRGQTVVVIISGGNIDAPMFKRALDS